MNKFLINTKGILESAPAKSDLTVVLEGDSFECVKFHDKLGNFMYIVHSGDVKERLANLIYGREYKYEKVGRTDLKLMLEYLDQSIPLKDDK